MTHVSILASSWGAGQPEGEARVRFAHLSSQAQLSLARIVAMAG